MQFNNKNNHNKILHRLKLNGKNMTYRSRRMQNIWT